MLQWLGVETEGCHPFAEIGDDLGYQSQRLDSMLAAFAIVGVKAFVKSEQLALTADVIKYAKMTVGTSCWR